MKNSYISIDLETTGLNPKRDKIMEIGALKVKDGQIESAYTTFVQPRRTLDAAITQLTGITDEMLLGAPGIGEIIGQLVEFCEDLPLLGHHIIFDFSFLKRAAANEGINFEKKGIDTLKICRLLMPENTKKTLSAACQYFHIQNYKAHRASEDAYAAHALYQELMSGFGSYEPEAFMEKTLQYKVKMEQTATKRQKEHLRELVKYHKIDLTVQIDYLSRNEVSRFTDKIISKYGRI